VDITERARIAALQITTAIPVITIPTLEEFPAVRRARMRATMGTLATDPGATDITAMAHAVTETVYPVATVAVGAPAYLVATVTYTVRPSGDGNKPSKLALSPSEM
jgi:hypothetical protein